MSTTRRRFLKAGMFAAMFAAVPLRNVPGQSWKERDGNPNENGVAQSGDSLSNYSKSSFRSYLNSIFQLQAEYGMVEVSLLEVNDLPGSRGGESFSLLFRGGSRQIRQNTYRMTHPSLGTFALFLVPTGPDRNGAQGYLATFNRISYGEALNHPAPRGASSRRQKEDNQ